MKFFGYIFRRKSSLVFIFVFSVLVSVINILGSVVFKYILSDIDSSETELAASAGNLFDVMSSKLSGLLNDLDSVCIVILLMYLLRSALQFARGKIFIKTVKATDISIVGDYYSHLIRLPMGFFSTRRTGELMSRFYDTESIRDAVSSAALSVIFDTVMAVGSSVILCFISVKLFFITFAMIIMYGVLLLLFRKPLRNVNYDMMERRAVVNSYLKETVDGIETLKSYNYGSFAEKKVGGLYEKYASKSASYMMMETLRQILVMLIESSGVIVLLWVGAGLCSSGDILMSDLFIFYYLINYFLEPVKSLLSLQPETESAVSASDRLGDVMDAQPEDSSELDNVRLTGDIVLDNISFRYGNNSLVFDKLDMVFGAGKNCAVVGETGCGKTTLAKLLLAFDKPESGEIRIGGVRLSDLPPDVIRSRIAYVPQKIFLFADTVYNNLRMGDDSISDSDIEAACVKYNIDGFIRDLSLGYSTMLDENGNNLSGGQRQRIAIVRSLLRKPDILILDEATSSLDNITENDLRSLMDEYAKDMTCVMIAHRLSTIRNCDTICVMDKGRMIESGTHDELMSLNGVYRKYFDAQSGSSR